MGTINKGILGGFSGKVGSVVGGNWKGIDYMRSKSGKRNFTASQAQLEQQAKFGLSIRFVQPFTSLAELSFRSFAVKKTGVNSMLSYVLKNAITGTYPAYAISYADVLVSRGDLPNALGPVVTAAAASIAVFSWTDNSGTGIAKADDKAILIAYSPVLKQCIYSIGDATRADITGDLNLATFSGEVVQTYLGFMSATGRNIASSIYTGSITVS